MNRAAVAVSAAAMMTKRRSKRSESQADRPSQEEPAKGAAGHQDGNSSGIEAASVAKT